LVPFEHTRIVVEHELEGAQAWGERHGVLLDWLSDCLQLRVTLIQPVTEAPYFLRAELKEYRALPPVWTFTDPEWQGTSRPFNFPKGVQATFGSSMFIIHNQIAVICAPFNRLAYADQSGPHGDWGGPPNWLNAGSAHIHAEAIGDMLQAIYRDFSLTRERMVKS